MAKKLALLNDELTFLARQLEGTSTPAKIYVPHLEKIRGAISAHNLARSWDESKNLMDRGVLTCLDWCGHVLRMQEQPLTEEELADILSELAYFGDRDRLFRSS